MINCQSMLGVRASGIWIPFVPRVGFYVDVKLLQSSGRGSVPTVPQKGERGLKDESESDL